MASLVLVETNGTLKTLKTKEVTEETLYKKCGFRINEDFKLRHTWKVTLNKNNTSYKYIISVWAKKSGKVNFENKYDFPPPIDTDLFFGTCAIVSNDEQGNFLDLTKEIWLEIYEKLFGGFEDLGDVDEYSEDELENVDPSLLTSNGYLKDDFVISDKEEIIFEEKPKKKLIKKASVKSTGTSKGKGSAKKAVKPSKKKITEDDDEDDDDVSDTSTSELEEEVYTFSDEE